MTNIDTADQSRTLEISRLMDAPKELIFDAWTQPRHISQWWGLYGWATTTHEIDFRKGGRWRFTMHSPDGNGYPSTIVYNEISRPDVIRYDHFEGDQDENKMFSADLELEDEGGKTRVRFRLVFPTIEALRRAVEEFNAEEGMKQTLVRLESRVARDILDDADEHTGLRIERTFNAPRDLVWEAWTDPKHVAKWHGPEGFTAPHVEADFRVGGKFLSCMEAPDGTQFWSTGMYHEIDPKDLIVASDYFADKDGNIVHASKYGMPEDFPLEMFVVTEFEDLNGTTKLTLTHYGMPAGEMTEGATQGWNQSLDKLAAIVEG